MTLMWITFFFNAVFGFEESYRLSYFYIVLEICEHFLYTIVNAKVLCQSTSNILFDYCKVACSYTYNLPYVPSWRTRLLYLLFCRCLCLINLTNELRINRKLCKSLRGFCSSKKKLFLIIQVFVYIRILYILFLTD